MCVSELKTHHRSDNVTDKFPNINWSDAVKISVCALTIFFQCAFSVCVFAANTKYATPELKFKVIAEHPHDIRDFTQGLTLVGDRLLESTGQYGYSALIEKDLRTGKPRRRVAIDARYFGEGIAWLMGRIYQLTWQNGIGIVYDAALRPLRQFTYNGEGWGLTSDGAQLILSNGSSRLRFFSPESLAEEGHLIVRDQQQEVSQLNELEYARGKIWANLWHSDRIAVIDPRSGQVNAWLDLATLRQRFVKPVGWDESDHVLNGIAYDTRSDRFLVTGKCWPKLFEISVSAAK